MAHLIDKDALVAEIGRLKAEALQKKSQCKRSGLERMVHQIGAYNKILSFLDTLEVKEIDEKPNPRFPHYEDIVDKVFGAGNLELWEYEEAEQLVLLAKEELLKDLEVKEVDLEKYYHEFLQKEWFGNSHVRTISEMMAFTAKHFFELGLKAQKGE